MEYNYYVYYKPEFALTIDKMPIWFKEHEYKGDKYNGTIILNSQNDYDEIWGPNSIMELNWEKKERLNLFFYKEIQHSIDVYNSIGIIVTEKKNDWLRGGHEFLYWFGHRRKMIRKRFYVEKFIHGIFYCDVSERLFNLHVSVIEEKYENFKSFVLKSYTTFICH